MALQLDQFSQQLARLRPLPAPRAYSPGRLNPRAREPADPLRFVQLVKQAGGVVEAGFHVRPFGDDLCSELPSLGCEYVALRGLDRGFRGGGDSLRNLDGLPCGVEFGRDASLFGGVCDVVFIGMFTPRASHARPVAPSA